MVTVAIIGTGVAGLSAAYALRGQAEIVLFERNDYIGGHTNTVEIEDEGSIHGLDTAFIVFNPIGYPCFSAFLKELGVDSVPHVGGFSFCDRVAGMEYGSADFELDKRVLESRHSSLLCSVIGEAKRFHRESGKDFIRGATNIPLGEYLARNGYSTAFRDSYISLLATAVWSVPPELIWDMPASSVISFFYYHGVGGLGGRLVDWRTVKGGSISYVRRVLDVVKPVARKNAAVSSVKEVDGHVEVCSAHGIERFDYAIVATHADQALQILAEPANAQRSQFLSRVRYNSARVVLHTDAGVMPRDRARWTSWNYARVLCDGQAKGYVAYYLNLIQGLNMRRPYFVTLDYPFALSPESIIREFSYSHPIIDMPVRELQPQIHVLNDMGRIKLCGSYFHSRELGLDLIGSHEAAFSSGKHAAQALLSRLQSDLGEWVI